MELVLLGLGAYAAYKLTRFASNQAQATMDRRRYQRQAETRSRQCMQQQLARQQRKHRRLQQLSRDMQAALLRLDDAPDFRRAASRAEAAKDVPTSFRQRQYQRFRPQLLSHFRQCIEHGTDAQTLLESLMDLVDALGVNRFEAEYIQNEAERRRSTTQSPNPAFAYASQVQQFQREHEHRMQALRGLQMDEEMRERLLEAEQHRFHEQLLGQPDM